MKREKSGVEVPMIVVYSSAELARQKRLVIAIWKGLPKRVQLILKRKHLREPFAIIKFGQRIIKLYIEDIIGRPITFTRRRKARPGERIWTLAEERRLERQFPATSIGVLMKRFKRSEYSIRGKASSMGLHKTRYGGQKSNAQVWASDEVTKLRCWMKVGRTVAYYMSELKRSRDSVEAKIHKLRKQDRLMEERKKESKKKEKSSS